MMSTRSGDEAAARTTPGLEATPTAPAGGIRYRVTSPTTPRAPPASRSRTDRRQPRRAG